VALIAPLSLVLLAAAVRLPTLGQQSFWLDEAYTVRLVRMSFGGMLRALSHSESTPPVYYVLAWAWTRVFGHSEAGLRSLSALAGIATVAVAYALTRRLGGRLAGVLAGVLIALSPFLVWFSQEARAYALATLFATITLWCLIRFLDTGATGWLWGWAAAAALGVATHYFVAFVVAPEFAWLLWRGGGRDRRVVGALLAVLAVGLALVPLAVAQHGTGHADYIAAGNLGERLLQVPKQLLIGYSSPAQVVTAVLAVLVVLVGAALALGGDREAAGRALIPLSIGLACVLAPALLALVGVDFLNTRNLLPALPALLIAAAIGFAASADRARGLALAGALALIFATVVVLVDSNARYQRPDWRGASDALGADVRPRALVVSPGTGGLTLALYQSRLQPIAGPVSVSEIDVVEIPPQLTGHGIAAPARPTAAFRPPAGFTLAGTRYTSTYAVLRLLARSPTVLTPAGLAATGLGSGGLAVLLQQPAR
jgi:mannosyltransferase